MCLALKNPYVNPRRHTLFCPRRSYLLDLVFRTRSRRNRASVRRRAAAGGTCRERGRPDRLRTEEWCTLVHRRCAKRACLWLLLRSLRQATHREETSDPPASLRAPRGHPLLRSGRVRAAPLAKELLEELPSIELPPYVYHRRRRTRGERLVEHRQQVLPQGSLSIQHVSVEEHTGDIIPDILVTSDIGHLIIEVAVTHKVDRAKLCRRNLPAIEIHLHAGDSFAPHDALRRKLQQDLKCKAWPFHPEQRHAERTFADMYRQALARSRHQAPVTFKPSSYRRRAAARPHVPSQSIKRSDWRSRTTSASNTTASTATIPRLRNVSAFVPTSSASRRPKADRPVCSPSGGGSRCCCASVVLGPSAPAPPAQASRPWHRGMRAIASCQATLDQ